MKFTKYVKDNISYILAFIVYCMIIVCYINAMKANQNISIVIIVISFIFFIITFLMNYYRKNKYFNNINKLMDGLQEKYLISEVIKKPKRGDELEYYKILKRANKSMLENVTNIKTIQKDYKEYIESWVHEIKIPITSSKLLCENNKSDTTNKIEEDIEEINNYVEQALFYARLDKVSNDFIIQETKLANVIKSVLLRNKKVMIQNDIKVELKDINTIVYSDEKWLEFIINQVLINSIKYKNDNNSIISISSMETKENVKLEIKDNGIGIKQSELDRIFDKGFTGTNGRNNKRSTGIGLYLCKKMCEELGMEIKVESKENIFTNIIIIIPRIKNDLQSL